MSQRDAARKREAEEALRRVKRESEAIGTSTLASAPPPANLDDSAIELWGRRIGRGLGYIAVAFILWHLVSLYFQR
jgi:ferric-dicitrate binding protein FerR (iron transport regulator)